MKLHAVKLPNTLMPTNTPGARKGAAWIRFLKWARTNRPEFYAQITANGSAPARGMGADNTAVTPWWEKLATVATGLYATNKAEKRQDKVLELQIEQAKQGQTPVDINDYATALRLQHEVDLGAAVNTLDPGTKTMLMMGGGVILALLAIPLFTALAGPRKAR